MNMRFSRDPGARSGFILMVVMVLMAASIFIMASAMRWTSNSAHVTDRNVVYQTTVSAAEAATESVMARLARDFQNNTVNASLSTYSALTPGTYSSLPWISGFRFSDGQGNNNATYVAQVGATAYDIINSTEYKGLYGIVSNYRVVSNARAISNRYDVVSAVKQEFQLATIPIFQFAIFYTLDLEINPGPVMTVSGKVHSNQNIYAAPQNGLTLMDSVTAATKINFDRHTNDPNYGTTKVMPVFTMKTNYQGSSGVNALTLPIGTNSSPDSVHEVLNPPPGGESATSPMGRQRYYNKSDLIVVVTDTGVSLKRGVWGSQSAITTNSGSGTGYTFIKTNSSFFNGREQKFVKPVEIDVGVLKTWIEAGGNSVNNAAVSGLGHNLNSIYVDDQRTAGTNQLAVRLVNGRYLPASGLTVTTKYPLYVQGHYNAPDISNGSTNTSATKPASLVGDSINILSSVWADTNSTKVLSDSTRFGADTTVNAAFIGGIVETVKDAVRGKQYSGGVENFPRFLEDWSGGRTLTFNGSMVVMFPSKYSTGFWQALSGKDYYSPPTRKWAFDLNFLDSSRLPPGTPQVQKLVRGQWAVVAPNNVN